MSWLHHRYSFAHLSPGSVTRLTQGGPRGFASPPHDGFAVSHTVAASSSSARAGKRLIRISCRFSPGRSARPLSDRDNLGLGDLFGH